MIFRCLEAKASNALHLTPLALIPMANQTSSTAANKSKKKKGVLGLIKQFKLPKVPVSAFGARDPVPGNDATHLEEDNCERNLTPTPIAGSVSTNSQVLDRKATTKESFNVTVRFVQTLLKRVPECFDANPVKMAFSIAKVIIEMKDVGCHLCTFGLGTG